MQEKCRDAAIELVDQFDMFLSVEAHVKELRQRVETERAVEMMVKLIGDISEYISSRSPNILSTLAPQYNTYVLTGSR